MADYPRTIDNGGGERLEIRNVVSPGSGPPMHVQRLVFPVVIAVGRLLGRHRRFEGAPEPRPAAAFPGS